jgi:hypothetical protein
MGVKVLVALVALIAVIIGLTLPGPSLGHKASQPSQLQAMDLHSS